MTARRSKGDGGLHWDENRQRWIASVTVGYSPAGKRIVRKASGKTKTEAKAKLREIIRDYEDGLSAKNDNYTVADAVRDWLEFGLSGREASTINNRRILAEQHVIPALGARKLRELSADDVDRWLAAKARTLSTETLRKIHSVLKRSIARAQARDKVKRNVVMLCEIPKGTTGRPSKSLTLAQAEAVLKAAESANLYAYVRSCSVRVRRNYGRSPGHTWTWKASPTPTLRFLPRSWCGARFVPGETPRPRSPVALWPCLGGAWRR
ncbi:hypothetical protein HD596_002731 [Nonomuraea jabiensis]|uniref:Core-binding (CB) domain-containing protein n=1 Tax=Nonomuraea jabiensis TaxID=882448 RepID=A0A7W9L9U1_9ACTN|nr:hypothetical protein [Nonomuraea jabiensis]